MLTLFTKRLGYLQVSHWLILFISFLLTITTWIYAHKQLEKNNYLRFERQAERLQTQIIERMLKYEQALHSGVAMLDVETEHPTSEVWQRFTESLHLERRHPGINGIGVIYNLRSATELEAHIAEQQKLRPNFKVHPQHTRNEFWPITYIEPEVINRAAIGLDIAFEDNRYQGILMARDSGKPTITGPIVLVQDDKKTPGFLFYVPRYSTDSINLTTPQERRSAFKDVVYAPFIMSTLMRGTLGASERDISLKVQDIGPTEKGAAQDIHQTNDVVTLYDEHTHTTPHDNAYQLTTIQNMYGRQWQLNFSSNIGFHKLHLFEKPEFILILGLLIEAILIMFFLRMAKANRMITRTAEEQRASRMSLFHHAINGMVMINQRGIISAANPACVKTFGYEEAELIGQNVKILMPHQYADDHDSYLRRYHDTGEKRIIGIGRTVEGMRKNGEVFPLELSVSKAELDGERVYMGILHDISGRAEDQAQLERTNAYLKLAEEMGQLGHWRVDIKDNALFWSPEVFVIHGRDPDKGAPPIGAAVDYYHRDDRNAVEQSVALAVETGESFEFEKRIITDDQKVRYVRSVGRVERDYLDNNTSIFGVIQDITHLKEKELELADTVKFYKTILDAVPDKIFVKDKNLRIIEANQAFWSMYDQPPEVLLNTTTLEKFPDEQAKGFIERDKKVLNGNVISETEEEITTASGHVAEHYTRKIPLESEVKGRVLVGLAQDISVRKQYEKERELLIKRLESSNVELEKFAFMASHDLQEPLRMVGNFSRIIQEDYADKMPVEAAQYLEHMHDGALRMQILIHDMLDYARLSHNEAETTRDFNPLKTIEHAQKNLTEAILTSGAQITLPTQLPKKLNGNPTRFISVMQNLIGNAIKYQLQGQTPEIKIEYEKTSTHHQFSVMDNGIGMKPAHFNKVFEPFQRLHRRDEYSGTGIGLASCYKIVENWGGKIWFESTYGQGSTFHFTLPVHK